jgi:uncharacterized protein
VKRPLIVTIVAIALVVLAIGAFIYSIQWNGHSYTPVFNLTAGNDTVVHMNVDSHTPVVNLTAGNGTVFHMNIEVADTPDEWENGLMNRTSMPWYAGMLFVFKDDEPRYFWMDNTLIPLDMLFITKDLTIIGIHENATPLSRDIIASSGPCRYVLEVNGGFCADEDIDIGDRITLDLT